MLLLVDIHALLLRPIGRLHHFVSFAGNVVVGELVGGHSLKRLLEGRKGHRRLDVGLGQSAIARELLRVRGATRDVDIAALVSRSLGLLLVGKRVTDLVAAAGICKLLFVGRHETLRRVKRHTNLPTLLVKDEHGLLGTGGSLESAHVVGLKLRLVLVGDIVAAFLHTLKAGDASLVFGSLLEVVGHVGVKELFGFHAQDQVTGVLLQILVVVLAEGRCGAACRLEGVVAGIEVGN